MSDARRHTSDWYCARCGRFVLAGEACFDCGAEHGRPAVLQVPGSAPAVPAPAALRPLTVGDTLTEPLLDPANGAVLFGPGVPLSSALIARLAAMGLTQRAQQLRGIDTRYLVGRLVEEAHALRALFDNSLMRTLHWNEAFASGEIFGRFDGLLEGLRRLDGEQRLEVLQGEHDLSHPVATALGAMLVAGGMGLPDRRIRIAAFAALFHDLGEVGDPLVNGPSDGHTERGVELLARHQKRIPMLGVDVPMAIQYHHADPLGVGFPLSVIPRIVAVADALDLARQDAQGRPRPISEVLDELGDSRARVLDPRLLGVLARELGVRSSL